jgi:phosphatidylserine decarboxylase
MKELIDWPNANPKIVTAATSFLCRYDYHKANYPTSEEYKATTRLRGEFLTAVLNTKANSKTKG